MTTLAAEEIRPFELGEHNDIPVLANTKIYEGSAVGITNAGFARPLVAGDKFMGFCYATMDNTGGANGAVKVNVKARGRVAVTITGIANTNLMALAYASDDDTFTLTSSSNSVIGRIIRVSDQAPNTAIVAFSGEAYPTT